MSSSVGATLPNFQEQKRGQSSERSRHVLGDRILAEAFQNDVRVVLVKKFASMGKVPWYQTIIFGFANLPSEDIILTLLVDAQCQHWETLRDAMLQQTDIWNAELSFRTPSFFGS
jgi:hypothetical protein